MALTVRAPAKVNLHLRVFPARDDGFHPLRSWFRTIDLHDELHVRAADTSGAGNAAVLRCDDPSVPLDESNLVHRAWRMMAEPAGPDVVMELVKRIPTGGGLGGGSSDAAAALSAYSKWRQAPGAASPEQLRRAAERLGSDVPFFLHHQLEGVTDATCTGRGEVVRPFAPGRRHAVLLILPGIRVATPAVYRQYDALPAPPDDGEPDFAAWSKLPAHDLLPLLRNDLERAAFSLHPELAELRRDAEAALGRTVRMTGSGSTLFTLFDDPQEAQDDASRVAAMRVRTLVA